MRRVIMIYMNTAAAIIVEDVSIMRVSRCTLVSMSSAGNHLLHMLSYWAVALSLAMLRFAVRRSSESLLLTTRQNSIAPR